jgi:nitroreductase
MQVKTVQMGCYEDYDRTNRFYQDVGFKELEVFPDLWDEANPCQIYVLSLKEETSLTDLIMSRRSYRGQYKPDKIPRKDLKTIMEAGLAAPSGCNKQTTSLIAVDDESLLTRIRQVIDPPVAQTAPAMICVLTQRINAYRDRCFATQDYSAAIENMLLAAAAMGYQSCWYEGHITDEDRIGDRIAGILGVPDAYELVCILPVGIAESIPAAPKKKPFEERAWFNGFGRGAADRNG